MFNRITGPYASMQELNLDWILGKIKNMLRFLPDDGIVGQVLRRTAHGAEWSDESSSGVSSVNGQTGDVVLDASDVGALPDSYTAPVTSVNGQTGAVSLTIPDSTSDLVNDSGFVDAAGAAAAAPVQSVNGMTGTVKAWMPFFKCTTAAATVAKTVTGGAAQGVTSLWEGLTILVYFTDTNSASNPTLQIDSLAAAPIYQYGTTAAGTAAATTAWNIGSPVLLTYDGTGWVMNKGYNTNTTYTVTDVLCTTSASTAAKTATGTYFSLAGSENKLFEITFRYTNTKASKITLNIASTGVKDVWLDGAVTSASNYSIKAGHYMCLYDATNDCYQLFSNGRMMADIIGTASGNYSSGNPPPYPVTSVNGNTGDVVIPTGTLQITTLWTNPDPTSTMGLNTLPIDLSSYDYYIVFCRYNTSTARLSGGMWFPVTGDGYQVTGARLNNNNSSSRSFTYDTFNNQLEISTGYYNGSTDTSSMIPVKILGVKL